MYHGAPVDCQDKRGYTPLFYASKAGWITNILELIEYGTNVNHPRCLPNQYTKSKTPLFRARTYDVVMLLLKNGADPTLKAEIMEEDGNKYYVTATEHLMKYNEACAKAILDNHINSDREDNLIIDFHMFENDGNEMALFEAARDNEVSSLLLHPIMQIFLNLKYKTVWTIFFIQMFFQIVLVIVFTAIGVTYVEFTSCKEVNITSSSDAWCNSMINCKNDTFFELRSRTIGCQPKNESDWNRSLFFPEKVHSELFYASIICRKNTLRLTENIDFPETICKFEDCKTFYGFYYVFLILLSIFFLKEMAEIFAIGIKKYVMRLECLNEALLSCLSLAFAYISLHNIYTDVMYTGKEFNHHHIALHLAAWMIFNVWTNLTLYLGRIQIIGVTIYMSLDVFKTMILVLLTFSPGFAAFTFGFFILLEANEGFESYTRTLIRSIAMMVGEFNFDDYFDFNVVHKSGGRNYSTQLMFIFFVITISLIVVNLLIALTVSRVDTLQKRSKLLQAKRKINDVVSLTRMMRCHDIKWLQNLFYQKSILDRLNENQCSQVCSFVNSTKQD